VIYRLSKKKKKVIFKEILTVQLSKNRVDKYIFIIPFFFEKVKYLKFLNSLNRTFEKAVNVTQINNILIGKKVFN
jgi:hypothetical protein